MALSPNPGLHQRTKLIDIRHHFLRCHISYGSVNHRYLSTKELPVDGLIKLLFVVADMKSVEILLMGVCGNRY